MDYGKRLLNFRAKHNLTQKQLGNILGVADYTIFRYEKNISKPNEMHKILYENKMKDYEVKKNEQTKR